MSTGRTFSASAVRSLRTLVHLCRVEREAKLKQGDVLVRLIDRCGLRPVEIAAVTKERRSDLSQMYHTAKTFPASARSPDVPYNHYLMAARMARKFPDLRMTPSEVLAEIRRHGFTQHRQVTGHFARKIREQQSLRAAAHITAPINLAENCFNCRYQELYGKIADNTVKIILADPPYANYRRLRDGRYSGGNVASTECDASEAVHALAGTLDLLRNWQPKLSQGGVLLLWQSSGPLRAPITEAIDRHNWAVEATVIWDKGNIQPGNFEQPYSTCCEWLWVLKRVGEKLVNHDNSSRSDILRFPPVSRVPAIADMLHAFEKPVELCRFLISKHSFPGELVFEPFGCTGSACVAAHHLGRRWIYAESYHENFLLGQARLTQALAASQRQAG